MNASGKSASDSHVEPTSLAHIKNQRRFRFMLVYLILLLPSIGWGAIQALQTGTNSPLDWVDANFAPRASYDLFTEQFGAGDVVVISWPECRIDEPKIDSFVRALRESKSFFEGDDWLFERVVSGQESLAVLMAPPLSAPIDEAKRQLNGSLLGPDGETTCVVITLNERGLKKRAELVPLIRAAATRYGGAEYASQHLAGPIMDGYAVDQASQRTMSRFAPLSSMVVFAVCALCLDSLYATLLVFGVSCVSQAIALAVVYYSGGEMTALLIVLPPLVQVLAIAGGIHFVNYYIDARKEQDPQAAVESALGVGWLPCFLSAATTVIGMGSLAVSGLAAVREFGIYAAIGVTTTLIAVLVLLPGGLLWWPLKLRGSHAQSPSSSFWLSATRCQEKYGTAIFAFATIFIIGLGIGLTRLQASVRIETLFGKESRLISDYRWLEEHVGALVPIEAVVSFDESSGLSAGERLEVLGRVENHLRHCEGVQSVASCLAFMPKPPPLVLAGPSGEQFLEQMKPHVAKTNYLATDGEGDQWRLTAYMSALGDLDYGRALDDIRESLDRELAAGGLAKSEGAGVSVRLSGLMPLVHEIQNQLLYDLFSSFLTAFALIAIVMTIIQAGFWSGLLAMIPNVFPAVTLFGVLGWLDHPIDIGSIMTASVAIGMAVDDTLHYLTFFQRCIDEGATRREAVLAAYQNCGRAMIQTSVVCGAGLAIFALSDFVPTARFAWMMVVLVAAALVGDLVILPAIILSPVGKVFETVRS
ncbi:MAG: efflux RND transporter permease subunit [Aureliella sp.]